MPLGGLRRLKLPTDLFEQTVFAGRWVERHTERLAPN